MHNRSSIGRDLVRFEDSAWDMGDKTEGCLCGGWVAGCVFRYLGLVAKVVGRFAQICDQALYVRIDNEKNM